MDNILVNRGHGRGYGGLWGRIENAEKSEKNLKSSRAVLDKQINGII
jgi:hypothetical protein